MPFGLEMSQDVFQQKCLGTISISDDVLVSRKDEKKQDINLFSLMEVTKEHGLVFNSTKCNIKTKFIKFFGGIYDKNGLHTDSQKVEDIKTRQSLTNELKLHHVQRMVTYMDLFIPRLFEHTVNLRGDLKKRIEYIYERTIRRSSNVSRLSSVKK